MQIERNDKKQAIYAKANLGPQRPGSQHQSDTAPAMVFVGRTVAVVARDHSPGETSIRPCQNGLFVICKVAMNVRNDYRPFTNC